MECLCSQGLHIPAPAELVFLKLLARVEGMLLIQVPCGSCAQTWPRYVLISVRFIPWLLPAGCLVNLLPSLNPGVWLVEEGGKALMVHVWELISAKRVPACDL